MMLSAVALLALAPEPVEFVCPTELPRKATKAKVISKDISAGDYPYIHHQNKDQTVKACVEVGVDGRVKSCAAHGGTYVGVNEHSCRVIVRRFRFEPAKDRKKRPINSFIVQTISWKISE